MRRNGALSVLVCCLLLAGCARQREDPIEFTLVEESAYTFSDGVSADLWHRGNWEEDYYRLSDGTQLLWVRPPVGPENIINGQESIRTLNETAREAIVAYYADRGLLYDMEQELERAYEFYLDCQESGKRFERGAIEQVIIPTGGSQRIIWFETILALPLDEPGVVSNTHVFDVFDRQTGDRLSVWDLFTVPEEEARRQLLSRLRPADTADLEEAPEVIAAALRPEYISIEADRIEVWFPKGTLPEGELDGWVLRYVDNPALLDILQPWAIPDGPEE